VSALLHTYRLGDCTVEVWEDNVRTILPHGTVVVAADSDMRRCIDHELAHTWIAVHYHRKWSPALWRKANSDLGGCTDYARVLVSDAQVAHEESIVLAYVASLTGDRRPWDEYEVVT
jgi:hypothetical protein